MTEDPIKTAMRRGMMQPEPKTQPKKQTKARRMANLYSDLAHAEEEIERYTSLKMECEKGIEEENGKDKDTKGVQQGSGSEEGSKETTG